MDQADGIVGTGAAARTLPLAHWRMKDFDAGAGAAARAFEAAADGPDWIDVPAPGDVYLALQAAGRLPDPFGDGGEAAAAWVADREWWWRCDFDAPACGPGQRTRLDFEGLDTLAEIWLNGERLGSSSNMFRPLGFALDGRLRPRGNRLAVRFSPTRLVEADETLPAWSFIADSIQETRRNLVRKAQFGWGWDWGPRLPTVGVWKPAAIRVETAAALTGAHFSTLALADGGAQARVAVEVAADVFAAQGALTADIVLTGPDGHVVASAEVALSDGRGRITFDLVRPRLWWTRELGEPALHDLSVTLKAHGAAVDERHQKVGIRTIALDTAPDPDEPGTRFFRFVLNGEPIFARGACWIPASSFVAAVDEPHYRRLLEMAAEANMNMIRIWGGGVYEHAPFYDLCDTLGLLVWQDFMFACAPYPEHDPAFVENVRAEVRAQVERLRSHACLALWCGNNECQAIGEVANRIARRSDPLPGGLYYDQIMPALVAELDPTTPYWPGSPAGGPSPNSMAAGDVHDWTVWHGVPPIPFDRPSGKPDHSPEGVAYTRYAEDMARFVSEYGIQASPVMETLKRALPEGQRTLGGRALMDRIKDRPKNKVDAMLIPVTGLPADLDEYVDFTQITQAEGLKFGIEHFRRRKPHCSGSLIWQLNDCWPGISWSLIDYYGFGKASYHYVRRAYAPVMASFRAAGDEVELWVVNDTLQTIRDEAEVALAEFAGGARWSATVDYQVGPNSSGCVWRGTAEGGPGQALTVRSRGGCFPGNRLFFTAIKDLDRASATAPEVAIEARPSGELAVRVAAPAYLWFVSLLAADEAVRFSDNYIDLAAGERRILTARHPARALKPEELTLRWR